MSVDWKKIIISEGRASIYLSLLSLITAIGALAYPMHIQVKQKEVDALLEFKQLYNEHARLINTITCIKAKAPDLILNANRLEEIKAQQQEIFNLITKNNGTGLGFDAQKATLIAYLKIVPTAEASIQDILLRATPEQFKTIKETCAP